MELVIYCLRSTYFPVFLKSFISFSQLHLLILHPCVQGQQEHVPSKGRLPRGAVLPPSLEGFRTELDKTLSKLAEHKMKLLPTDPRPPSIHSHDVNRCRFTRSEIFVFLFPPSVAVPPDICCFGLRVGLSGDRSAMPPGDYPPGYSALARPHLGTASGFQPELSCDSVIVIY